MKAQVTEWQTDALNAPEGSVNLSGGMTFSDPRGGCGTNGCKCSPGWWISISLPVNPGGIVMGYSIQFDNVRDMREFLEIGRVNISKWLDRPF